MHRSKLENYQTILSALAMSPLPLDNIAYICKMDCVNLNQRMDFLRRNNLIEEKTQNSKQAYALTQRGKAILKTLTIAKRLEELQTSPIWTTTNANSETTHKQNLLNNPHHVLHW